MRLGRLNRYASVVPLKRRRGPGPASRGQRSDSPFTRFPALTAMTAMSKRFNFLPVKGVVMLYEIQKFHSSMVHPKLPLTHCVPDGPRPENKSIRCALAYVCASMQCPISSKKSRISMARWQKHLITTPQETCD
jgi:hypothetical protein